MQVNSKLPAQKILLASSKNKKQLVQLIVDDLVLDKRFPEDSTRHHKLVVTGADPVPIEISEDGVVISRADLATSHEEADNVIVQKVLSCAAENAENKITVVTEEAQNPPELDSTEYGWVKDDQNKSLQPVTLPDEVELVPEMVLRLIKCGCHSTTPCSLRACNCNSANIKCTIFCACYNQGYCNPTS